MPLDWTQIILAVLVLVGQVATTTISLIVLRKTEQVHKATNSLTFRLVEATEKEAHQRGRDEEKAKQVVRDQGEKSPP